MNQLEADRIAEGLEDLARDVRAGLVEALRIAHGWRGPLRATGYEPTGSSVGGDPTLAAVLTEAPDKLRHTRILAAVGQVTTGGPILRQLIHDTVPSKHKPRTTDDDEPGEGWCVSCWRIRFLSPEHTHADGRVKHKGLCQWCASFIATNGRQPPDSLLKKRRDGKKISEQDVNRALGKAS